MTLLKTLVGVLMNRMFYSAKFTCIRVPYIAFVKTLERIEGISSRLKIIEVLANFYRSVGVLSPKELPNCINMSINRLGPSYEGLELGIGESLLIKALTLTTGTSNDRIKLELNRLGDLGAVAEAIKSRQQTMFKPKSLTLQVVYDRLKEIAFMVGNAVCSDRVQFSYAYYLCLRVRIIFNVPFYSNSSAFLRFLFGVSFWALVLRFCCIQCPFCLQSN